MDTASQRVVIGESDEAIGGGSDDDFSLNPFLTPAWHLNTMLTPVLHAGAFGLDEQGEFVPDLVEALPDASLGTATRTADGRVRLDYRIPSDAAWDDGTPVTAADFKRTLEILQDARLPIRRDWRIAHASVTSFEGSGDRFSIFLDDAAGFRSLFPVVVPAHVVDVAGFDSDWSDRLWPSAARFTIDTFADDVLRLVRNPAVADTGQVDVVEFQFFDPEDEGEALAAFALGAVDLLGPLATGPLAASLLGETVAISETEPTIFDVVFLQPGPERLEANDESALARPEVRAIVADTIRRVSAPTGMAAGLGDIFAPALLMPTATAPPDLGALRQAVDRLDVDETPVVFAALPDAADLAESVTDALDEIGFDADEDEADDPQDFFDDFRSGAFELAVVPLVRRPGTEGLVVFLRLFDPRADGFVPVLWDRAVPERGAAFAALLDEIDSSLDAELRAEAIRAATRMLEEENIVVPLAPRGGWAWIHDPLRVTGPRGGQSLESFLSSIDDWERVDRP